MKKEEKRKEKRKKERKGKTEMKNKELLAFFSFFYYHFFSLGPHRTFSFLRTGLPLH